MNKVQVRWYLRGTEADFVVVDFDWSISGSMVSEIKKRVPSRSYTYSEDDLYEGGKGNLRLTCLWIHWGALSDILENHGVTTEVTMI